MKQNVLQLIGSFHQGGSERQAVQLTRLLRESGAVNVFAATLNKEGVLLSEVEKLDLPAIPEFKLASFYDVNFLRQVKNCARFLRENKIEIVHTHDFYTNVFGIAAARIAKIPLKIASKRETGGMRSKAQQIIERQIFKTADQIVVNSEAVKNYLIEEKIKADKICVIYNGLDLDRLKPKITDRKTICELLNLPTDERIKFVTLVANLRHAVKNQPLFLRAAREVLKREPDTHFVIAGEGELREALENLAREFGIENNTHFIGRCVHIPELLEISDICVLTSFHEGFSNSILEYMAAGKPVVATNVGGAAEAVIANETGFLVASDDTIALTDALLKLLENKNLAETFGKNGRRVVEEKFTLAAQLEATLKLYGKMKIRK